MVTAVSPQFSIKQAIEFSGVFRNPALFEDGKFRQSQLKILDQEERKICLEALERISTAQLSDWENKKANPIDPAKLEVITKKISELPADKAEESAPWYKVPFLWIAQKAHSFFLWFQNTFMGRITSKHLLNQVAIFSQNANTAKSDVDSIEKEILPEVQSTIKKRIQERDEVILKGNLANGLLEIYKILLALKSEGKREHIMQKAIAYSTIEDVASLETKPFFVIVRDLLYPYFEANKKKEVPKEKFEAFAVSYQEANEDPSPEKVSSLQKNYGEVMTGVGPLLVFEKAKKAKTTLAPLYEAAGKAIELSLALEQAVKKLKDLDQAEKETVDLDEIALAGQEPQDLSAEKEIPSEDSPSGTSEKEELKAKVLQLEIDLKTQDIQIQEHFDSIFKEIEKEIDEEGGKLYKNKYGTSPELNAETSRLQLDRLKEYGLQSLVFHEGKLLEKAELLKRKYLPAPKAP